MYNIIHVPVHHIYVYILYRLWNYPCIIISLFIVGTEGTDEAVCQIPEGCERSPFKCEAILDKNLARKMCTFIAIVLDILLPTW